MLVKASDPASEQATLEYRRKARLQHRAQTLNPISLEPWSPKPKTRNP